MASKLKIIARNLILVLKIYVENAQNSTPIIDAQQILLVQPNGKETNEKTK